MRLRLRVRASCLIAMPYMMRPQLADEVATTTRPLMAEQVGPLASCREVRRERSISRCTAIPTSPCRRMFAPPRTRRSPPMLRKAGSFWTSRRCRWRRSEMLGVERPVAVLTPSWWSSPDESG